MPNQTKKTSGTPEQAGSKKQDQSKLKYKKGGFLELPNDLMPKPGKTIKLDNGTLATMRGSMLQLCNFNHKIREFCPSCRQETTVDFKRKIMTCENKNCKYFDKQVISIVKKRKPRSTNAKINI